MAETTKKLSRGVGKRIIESLKAQELQEDILPEQEPETIVQEMEEIIEETEEITEPEEEEQEYPEEYVCSPNAGQNAEMSDIDTLLALISRLPNGVTKQTGAIIIRQTMEAMGISMNNVLSNAQSVQEELENSVRNNINVIEEYRTKIQILEKEIQKFKKKAHELEDIISLFILSEEKK